MSTQRQQYDGPALLSYGFRPFFLIGSLYAGLSILLWLPQFYGELELATAFSPLDWHVHEMFFGYVAAVVTGFLFTAVPNWTGRMPIRGKPLLLLLLIWIGGRLAGAFFGSYRLACWRCSSTLLSWQQSSWSSAMKSRQEKTG